MTPRSHWTRAGAFHTLRLPEEVSLIHVPARGRALVGAALLVLAVSSSVARAGVPSIVGGGPAPVRYPWYADLEADTSGLIPQFLAGCGGALVAPKVVVTTALCAILDTPTAVRLGPTRHSRGDGEVVPVDSVVINPNAELTAGAVADDLAIVRLARPAHSTPIRIAGVGGPAVATSLTEVGWGALNVDGAIPDAIQQVGLPVVPDAVCRARYGTSYDAPSTFCAGTTGVGPCLGDLGTPVVRGLPGSPELVGLVSFERIGSIILPTLTFPFESGCGRPDLPVAMTRLTAPSLRNWPLSNPPVPPQPVTPPRVIGRPNVGQRLTCNKGLWLGERLTFRYLWVRNRTQLPHTGPRYRLVRADRGALVRCVVIGSNASGSLTVDADPIGPIRRPLPPPDHRAPRVTAVVAACRGGTCRVTVRANDGRGRGIREVRVALRGVRRDGSILLDLRRARRVGRGRFRAAFRLDPGTYSVQVLVDDAVGNRTRPVEARMVAS
jgi:hypothetical protein